jgi:membrane-bound metal-dependent hydrolase YbcI (DUF457 family)
MRKLINLLTVLGAIVLMTLAELRLFFRVEDTKRNQRRRRAVIVPFAVLLSVLFVFLYATAYENSYNIMNSERLTVFEIKTTENETVITVLGRTFTLKK